MTETALAGLLPWTVSGSSWVRRGADDPFGALDNTSGAVFIYRRFADGTWGGAQSFYGAPGDRMGYDVHVEGDRAIAVGTPSGAGPAWMFYLEDDTWYLTETPGGYGTTTAIDGRFAVSGRDGGVFRFLERDVDEWFRISGAMDREDPETDDNFGGAVDVVEDRLFVSARSHDNGGAINNGAIYVFNYVNSPPEWSSSWEDFNASENQVERVIFGSFRDTDGDRLDIGIASPPANGTLEILEVSTSSPTSTSWRVELSYTPDPEYFGTDPFTLYADDGETRIEQELVVNVLERPPPNQRPDITLGTDLTLINDQTTSAFFSVEDDRDSGDDIEVSVVSTNQAVIPDSGLLYERTSVNGYELLITPTPGAVGILSLRVEATDTEGLTRSATWRAEVIRPNDPPIIRPIEDVIVGLEQSVISFNVPVEDDYDRPSSMTALGISSDQDVIRTSFIEVRPNDADGWFEVSMRHNREVGQASIRFEVTDTDGSTASERFTFTVTDQTTAVNDAYEVAASGSLTVDAPGVLGNDIIVGDTWRPEVTRMPQGTLSLADDGSFRFQPMRGGPRVDGFEYVLTDGRAQTLPARVEILVINNAAPVLGELGGPYAVDEGTPLSLTFTAMDADGDDLVFSALPRPPGASMSADGVFNWTPGWGDVGEHTVGVRVSDSYSTDSGTFVVSVSMVDLDMDGLSDAYERDLGLDPTSNDSDGDSIADADEIGDDLLAPPDSDRDGDIDALDEDSDDDGWTDAEEAGDDDILTAPVDTDDDGTADFRDIDSDDDTITDDVDNCPLIPNEDQADENDDGFGDACDTAEICDDGMDNDSDGDTDCQDVDCVNVGPCQMGDDIVEPPMDAGMDSGDAGTEVGEDVAADAEPDVERDTDQPDEGADDTGTPDQDGDVVDPGADEDNSSGGGGGGCATGPNRGASMAWLALLVVGLAARRRR